MICTYPCFITIKSTKKGFLLVFLFVCYNAKFPLQKDAAGKLFPKLNESVIPPNIGTLTDVSKLREYLPYTSSIVSGEEQKALGMNSTPLSLF